MLSALHISSAAQTARRPPSIPAAPARSWAPSARAAARVSRRQAGVRIASAARNAPARDMRRPMEHVGSGAGSTPSRAPATALALRFPGRSRPRARTAGALALPSPPGVRAAPLEPATERTHARARQRTNRPACVPRAPSLRRRARPPSCEPGESPHTHDRLRGSSRSGDGTRSAGIRPPPASWPAVMSGAHSAAAPRERPRVTTPVALPQPASRRERPLMLGRSPELEQRERADCSPLERWGAARLIA
jgi:hypothetical protein